MSFISNENLDTVFDNIIRRVANSNLNVNTKSSSVDALQLSVEKSGRLTALSIPKRDLVTLSEEFLKHSDKDRLVCKAQIMADDDTTIGDCFTDEDSVISVVERSLGVELKVESLDGRTIIVENIRKSDRIMNIEKKIKERIRFERDEHRLEHLGVVLEYDDTVEGSAISEGSVIKVVKISREEMRIYLKTENGLVVPLTVGIDESIIGTKRKIQDKIGLFPGEQKLFYRGELLEDDKTLLEHHIVENSFVDLGTQSRGGRIILAQTMDGRKVAFGATKDDTIMDIKKKIQEKLTLYPDEQTLVFRGQRLEDDKSVDYYHIDGMSVIHVKIILRGYMEIFFTCGEDFVLQVTKKERIIDIKKKFHEKTGQEQGDAGWVCNGRNLEDDKTVEYYDLVENSTIIIIHYIMGGGMEIFAQTMDGNTVSLDVLMYYTIMDVKKKIQEKTGVEPVKQILLYQGRILEDDNGTLEYYKIDGSSTVRVVSDSRDVFGINIKIVDSPLVTLIVTSIDTIIELKERIKEMRGLSNVEVFIKVKGVIVENHSMTMLDCNIVKGDTIEVSIVERLTINILTFNMETVVLEVLKSDRVADLKKRIEMKIGLLQEEQILVHRRKIICVDSKTVAQCKVLEKSDIVVTATLGNIKEQIRGLCLVISNEKFTNGSDSRIGTKEDEDNIRRTFEPMGFETVIRRDQNLCNMGAIFEETKKKVRASHSMLIVFILSHGERGGFMTADGKIVPLADVYGRFTNGNLPSFAGKPKLFFFAFCRGSERNAGVCAASAPRLQYDGPREDRGMYPEMGDMFIGHATCMNYLSLRDTEEGTLYVKHLCDIIREHREWSVADIHQELQTVLSKRDIMGENWFQMPYCENILTKRTYFVDEDD